MKCSLHRITTRQYADLIRHSALPGDTKTISIRSPVGYFAGWYLMELLDFRFLSSLVAKFCSIMGALVSVIYVADMVPVVLLVIISSNLLLYGWTSAKMVALDQVSRRVSVGVLVIQSAAQPFLLSFSVAVRSKYRMIAYVPGWFADYVISVYEVGRGFVRRVSLRPIFWGHASVQVMLSNLENFNALSAAAVRVSQ